MYEPKKGDHVRIHTKTHGCYDERTGTVINKMTSDMKAYDADTTGFLDWHMCADGYFRVKFDKPVIIEEDVFDHDIFTPDQLTIEEV